MQSISRTPMQPDLGAIWDQVARSREAAEINWPGREAMALLPAAELRAMQETLHLLSSRANARALFDAMDELDRGEGQVFASVAELQKELGLDNE